MKNWTELKPLKKKVFKAAIYMEVTRELVQLINSQLPPQGSAPTQDFGVFCNSSLRDSRPRSAPEIVR